MIESVNDLDLGSIDNQLDNDAFEQAIDKLLTEKLGASLVQIKQALETSIQTRANEIAIKFPHIAPFNEYSKLLENNDEMASFLKDEAAQAKHWIMVGIEDENKHNFIKFSFINKSVDDGKSLSGIVFVSKKGVIKHAFGVVDV